MQAGSATDVSPAPGNAGHVTLEALAAQAPGCPGVRESDVLPGDWIIIRTKNSTYSLRANGDGTFDASGGWFSRNERSGERLRIAGCTWGGSALLTGMIAAPGMCVEFTNRVTTTRIRTIRHIRPHPSPTTH
jgi:hypothetical protein